MSTTIQHDEEIGSTRFRAVRLVLRREAQLSPDLTRLESHSTTTAFLVVVQGGDGATERLNREELAELRDVCNETLERWTEPIEPIAAWERELLDRQAAASSPEPKETDAADIEAQARAGEFDDPITKRRREAKAVRFEPKETEQ